MDKKNIYIKLLRCTIVTNKKLYLYIAAIFAAGIVLVSLLSMLNSIRIGGIDLGYITTVVGSLQFLALTYFSTSGAVIVGNIKHKQQRIAEFMLPASKLEKFLTRYVHLIILIPLAALVGVAVGDILQMIIMKIAKGDAISILANFFKFGAFLGNGDTFIMIDNIIIFLFTNSLFLAVGSIFRRYAWIKSNIVIFTGLIVLIILIVAAMKYSLDFIYGEDNYDLVLLGSTARRAILYPIGIVLAAFNYWFGYHVYSRMQIAANSWHNL